MHQLFVLHGISPGINNAKVHQDSAKPINCDAAKKQQKCLVIWNWFEGIVLIHDDGSHHGGNRFQVVRKHEAGSIQFGHCQIWSRFVLWFFFWSGFNGFFFTYQQELYIIKTNRFSLIPSKLGSFVVQEVVSSNSCIMWQKSIFSLLWY